MPALGSSRMMESAVTLLPQPELADDAERAAGSQREAYAADGFREAAAVALEDDAQVLDGEERRHAAHS